MIGNRYPVAVGLVGDTGASIRALLERLSEREMLPWRSTVEKVVEQGRDIARLRAEIAAKPLNPELVVRSLSEWIPDNAQVAIDVGSSVYHYVRQLTLPTGAHAHLSSTLASMGCSVPYAIAAKEVDPQRPVVALAGDGAMEMLGINELITVAARWRTWSNSQLVLIVLNNRDLAEVSWEQRESESEPRFGASQSVPYFNFAAYAEQLGLYGVVLDDASKLNQVLDAAFQVERPVVIDLHTDPDIPLLPPFPHGKQVLDSMRAGLHSEGETGRHGLELLEKYAAIEARRLQEKKGE
jgi:pyruvate dehydrogenase (quinone)